MYYNNEKINTSDIVMNKTRSYLVQQLQYYGDEFVGHIAKNRIIAFTIGDYGHGSEKLEPYIYMLFDVNGEKKYGNYLSINKGRYIFHETLQYYQHHTSYVQDYCFDSNKTGHLHVVVIKLPFPEKFDLFLEGKYSKMYSEDELNKWFIKEFKITEIVKGKKKVLLEKNSQYQVLTHDTSYFPKFKEEIKNEFGTILSDEDIHVEYDFKPSLKKETLRHG